MFSTYLICTLAGCILFVHLYSTAINMNPLYKSKSKNKKTQKKGKHYILLYDQGNEIVLNKDELPKIYNEIYDIIQIYSKYKQDKEKIDSIESEKSNLLNKLKKLEKELSEINDSNEYLDEDLLNQRKRDIEIELKAQSQTWKEI